MPEIPARIRRFCKRLQDEQVGENVYNFYHAKRTNSKRANLERYLSEVYASNSEILLIGEAPGYNGCRLTGVPFSSEHIVFHGTKRGHFGVHKGYKASKKIATKEQSASAVWEVLDELNQFPLLWNAFPFHPFKYGNPESNRKPNEKELLIGRKFLVELIRIFGIKHVIAIGNVADNTLSKMGIEHVKVRHPSYGGKSVFKAQLSEYYSYRV